MGGALFDVTKNYLSDVASHMLVKAKIEETRLSSQTLRELPYVNINCFRTFKKEERYL